MIPISVVIITNKINSLLFDVIESFHENVDEICIGVNQIDLSTIEEIASKYPKCRWHEVEWKGYGPTKNELNSLARNNWILTIDSDEVADKSLIKGLQEFDFTNCELVGAFKSLNYFNHQPIKYGSWGFDKSSYVGLFNRAFVQWSEDEVHEKLIIPRHFKTYPIAGFVHHYTSASKEELLKKSIHYGKLGAFNKIRKGGAYQWWKAPISAAFLWIKEYIFQLGILDGKAGLTIANSNAVYTYYKYNWMKMANKNTE